MKFLALGFARKKQVNIVPVAIFISVVLAFVVMFLYQAINGIAPITSINVWEIDEQSTIQAEILWQKSVPCLYRGLGNPNRGFVVSESQLVLPCEQLLSGDVAIAYDLVSGEEEWQESANSIDEIINLPDGYIFVFNDSDVKMVDYSGDVIWHYEFTSRNVRTIIPCGDFICIPEGDTGLSYIYSAGTGTNVQNIEMENILAVYPDIFVRNVATSVEVFNSETQSIIWITPVPYQLTYENFTRYNDILLIHYAGYIQAFDILTGTLIWEVQEVFRSAPLLVNDNLFVYTIENSIEVYDVVDGDLSGSITLHRSDTEVSNGSIALSGNRNMLAIVYYATQEVILLNLDFGR